MTKNFDARDEALPPHLKQRPRNPLDWPLPTAWLLGTKLIGSLRDILLSSVVKVDLRTWMTAGNVVDRTNDTIDENGERCCYIDFLADTGDSQRLVFQLARLLKQEQLAVTTWIDGVERTRQLPRGSMLILGGDIAYPIATHRRLLDRIRAPFKWAHDELDKPARERLAATPVTLLAVPGNHDYYDGLRGFEALLHSPPVSTSIPSAVVKPPSEQALHLPGYALAQHASYFSAALPFGWRVWGLDIENREIDDRQTAFFEWTKTWKPGVGQQEEANTPAPHATPPPEKLIVVTSRPAFVYQGPSDHAAVIEASLKRLAVPPAFAEGGTLAAGQVRLDLSGDVHLYERYWGTDQPEMPDDIERIEELRRSKHSPPKMAAYEPPERYGGKETRKRKRRGNDQSTRSTPADCSNYASVVSGLGGTFHHPSQIRMGITPPRAAWPSAEHSAREIGTRLADPAQVFRAGAVGVVGLAISLACYFLVWESNTTVNVLDVPFALSRQLSTEQVDALWQLVLVAQMIGVIAVMVALPVVAYYVGRYLSTPIREMRDPYVRTSGSLLGHLVALITYAWQRVTKYLTHEGPFHWIPRLLGSNPRSSWLFAINLPPLAGAVIGIWFLYGVLRDLGAQVFNNGLVVVYTILTLLVLGMAALGALRAGQRNPLESLPINLLRRTSFFIFGVVIALLVVWTPYAWVRLICRNPLFGGMGIVVIALTMLVRFGRTFFPRGLVQLRMTTGLGLVLLIAGAVLMPLCFARMAGPVTNAHSAISIGLAAPLGAYFASLWVGWYFCICLQWNAHGNEAGSAARITEYGEFLRIKLTEDKAEVWAIAVEEMLDPDPPWYHRLFNRKATLVDPRPVARVIDHFTVKC